MGILTLLCGFTAILCWWIGIAGVVNSQGGAYLFLGVPALLTVGTFLLGRRRHQTARHRGQPRLTETHNRLPSPQRQTVVLLCGFAAVLCWWIGIVGVVNSQGGAYLFLGVPALLTLGTLGVWRQAQQRRSHLLP
jgi:hypothetical protein